MEAAERSEACRRRRPQSATKTTKKRPRRKGRAVKAYRKNGGDQRLLNFKDLVLSLPNIR